MKTTLPEGKPINCMLQSRAEIDVATEELQRYGLLAHPISCKNFDLARICPRLTDGDMLDMGSAGGSCILENAAKIGIEGRKIGIDLEYSEDKVSPEGIEFKKMDLMNTIFPDSSFNTIFCLSVIEHQVSFNLLAAECGRLLKPQGQLWITCDFFEPKPSTEGMKLYSLNWEILDRKDIERLVSEMAQVGLKVSSDINYATNEAVINPTYCSPAPVSYTFCILNFIKQ